MKKHTCCVLALLAAALVSAANMAHAQMGGVDGRQLAYEGRLDLDGVPANGLYDMRMGLFTLDGGATTCLDAVDAGACGAWWTEFAGVLVDHGVFQVVLGANGGIPDLVLQRDDLYVAMAVKGSSDSTFTLMAGTHRLQAVPFVARVAAARDFKVTGHLVVRGNQTMSTGQTRFGNVMRQLLQLWSDDLAVGVQDRVLYFRTNDDFQWFRRGVHADVRGSAGSGGTVWMSLPSSNNLTVNDNMSAQAFKPQYDSGWQQVSAATNDMEFPHNFGSVPTNVMLQACGAPPVSGQCTTPVSLARTLGQHVPAIGSQMNPLQLTADNAKVYAAISSDYCTFEYFRNGGWINAGNCRTAYYRLLAWR